MRIGLVVEPSSIGGVEIDDGVGTAFVSYQARMAPRHGGVLDGRGQVHVGLDPAVRVAPTDEEIRAVERHGPRHELDREGDAVGGEA